MSTSRCFRRLQYRARKRGKKIMTRGACGAAVGVVIGETLFQMYGEKAGSKSVYLGCEKMLSSLIDDFKPHLADAGVIKSIVLQCLLIAMYLICKGGESLRNVSNAVDSNPVIFLRVAPIVLGAFIGMAKGCFEDIPDFGEEPIAPERSLSYAGRF